MPNRVFVKPYTREGRLVKGYWRKLRPGDLLTFIDAGRTQQAKVKSVTPNGAITTDGKIVQARQITGIKPAGAGLPQTVDRTKTMTDYTKPSGSYSRAMEGTSTKNIKNTLPVDSEMNAAWNATLEKLNKLSMAARGDVSPAIAHARAWADAKSLGEKQAVLNAAMGAVRRMEGTANAKPYESHSQRLERLYKPVPTHENDPAAASKIELNALMKEHIAVTKQMEANLAKGDNVTDADMAEFSALTRRSQDLAKRIRDVKKYIKQWQGGTRNVSGGGLRTEEIKSELIDVAQNDVDWAAGMVGGDVSAAWDEGSIDAEDVQVAFEEWLDSSDAIPVIESWHEYGDMVESQGGTQNRLTDAVAGAIGRRETDSERAIREANMRIARNEDDKIYPPDSELSRYFNTALPGTTNRKPISEMTDFQIAMEIRQIESSPTAHRPASIMRQVEEHLANLREELRKRGGTPNLFGAGTAPSAVNKELSDEELRTAGPLRIPDEQLPQAIAYAMEAGDLERADKLQRELDRRDTMYGKETRDRNVRAFRQMGDRVGAAYAMAGFAEKLATLALSEDEMDHYLRVSLMAQTGGFSKGTANVSAHDVRKLKPLMRHYAKMAHPFTACVRDNRKRFGPGAEAVCAVLKDLIKGTTKWRKGGHKKAHLSEDFALEVPESFAVWLATVTPQQIEQLIEEDIAREAIMQHPHSQQVMAEMFFSEQETPVEDNGLIWKTILREGQWVLSPGPGQKPQPKPITVVTNGRSDGKRLVISMEELKRNFDAGAVEHVTVPVSHADKVTENTGYVRDLKFGKDHMGRTTLLAGLDFTEPDIREKVRRGTIANISSGILFDYAEKERGQKFAAVLGHAALTNKPWLNGMPPFGIEASETEGLQVLAFSEESNDPATTGGGETVSDGADTLMDKLGLSEDEISARLADYDRMRAEEKKRNITDKCKAWEAEGKAPAVITVARELMMSDDGGAVLHLSEEGSEVGLTATDIVERLVNAVPQLSLSDDPVSDQDTLGDKPKDDASDENEAANLSQALKNEAAAIFLSGEAASEEDALKLAKERKAAKTTES